MPTFLQFCRNFGAYAQVSPTNLTKKKKGKYCFQYKSVRGKAGPMGLDDLRTPLIPKPPPKLAL